MKNSGGAGEQRRAVLFLAPMADPAESRIPAPAQVLGPALAQQGLEYRLSSFAASPGRRITEMVTALVDRSATPEVAVLSIFGGRSLVQELAVLAAARKRAIPVIGVVHGGGLADRSHTERRRTRTVLEGCARVVAPSGWLARELRHLCSRIEVIPNPIDLTAIEHRQRTRFGSRALWMRSLHRVYRPDLAIDTLNVLAQPPAPGDSVASSMRLTLAGPDKGEAPACRAQVRDLGLRHRVFLPGMLGSAEKYQAMATHDLFLNTNDIDNAPVSLVEAAAAGLPAVATRVGGIAELSETLGSVVTVEPGSAAELARAVSELAADPDRFAELSQRLSLIHI